MKPNYRGLLQSHTGIGMKELKKIIFVTRTRTSRNRSDLVPSVRSVGRSGSNKQIFMNAVGLVTAGRVYVQQKLLAAVQQLGVPACLLDHAARLPAFHGSPFTLPTTDGASSHTLSALPAIKRRFEADSVIRLICRSL